MRLSLPSSRPSRRQHCLGNRQKRGVRLDAACIAATRDRVSLQQRCKPRHQRPGTSGTPLQGRKPCAEASIPLVGLMAPTPLAGCQIFRTDSYNGEIPWSLARSLASPLSACCLPPVCMRWPARCPLARNPPRPLRAPAPTPALATRWATGARTMPTAAAAARLPAHLTVRAPSATALATAVAPTAARWALVPAMAQAPAKAPAAEQVVAAVTDRSVGRVHSTATCHGNTDSGWVPGGYVNATAWHATRFSIHHF
jgi:hypothetical protein